jgi:protein-disulfide isomerase
MQSTPAATPAPVAQEVLVKEDSVKDSVPSSSVTLVEFGDFQCPTCAVVAPDVEKIREEYKGKITFVFRYFPLEGHKNAVPAAIAAEAANQQGKFWLMSDKLYQTQDIWGTVDNPNDLFVGYAKELGLDEGKFKASLNDQQVKDKVNKDKTDGYTAGVNGTPTFYFNGSKLPGVPTYSGMKALLDSQLSTETQTASPSASVKPTSSPSPKK